MRSPIVFALVPLMLLALCACGGTSTETPEEAVMEGPCPSLVGSWELVSIADEAEALSGDFASDPDYQEAPTLKILNDTHWMFIRQSAERFVHAQGGRYALEPGGFYTEFVEYSAIPTNVGQSFQFECRIEGDSLWYHIGGQGDNRYNETWRRVR